MREQGYDGASSWVGMLVVFKPGSVESSPEHNMCIDVPTSSISVLFIRQRYELSLMLWTPWPMYLWPSTSPNRLLEFQEQLEHNALVREEMGNRVKLKTLCESRWAYGRGWRHHSKRSWSKGHFIITAVTLQHIFEYTHRLSVALQSSDQALVVASKKTRVWICTLESERNDESVLHALLEKFALIASKHGIHQQSHEQLEGNSSAPMLRQKTLHNIENEPYTYLFWTI